MAIDLSPRFTVSMRGYDKEEVEHYLATVAERTSQAEDQLYELQEQNRYLEEEHERLGHRVEELEVAIRSETPRTVGALGERITIILNEAEQGASETLTQAKADAEYLVGEAQTESDRLRREAALHAAEAVETLAAAKREAEALAERLEAEATARAAGILNNAEVRAQRRREQMETWAQEMIARTEAEQARMADEFAVVRRHHDIELAALLGDRNDTLSALRSLQASLSRAVDRVADSVLPAGANSPNGLPEGSTGAIAIGAAAPPAPATGPKAIPKSPPTSSSTGSSSTGSSSTGSSSAGGPTSPAVAEPDASPRAPVLYDLEDDSETGPSSIIRIGDWSTDNGDVN